MDYGTSIYCTFCTIPQFGTRWQQSLGFSTDSGFNAFVTQNWICVKYMLLCNNEWLWSNIPPLYECWPLPWCHVVTITRVNACTVGRTAANWIEDRCIWHLNHGLWIEPELLTLILISNSAFGVSLGFMSASRLKERSVSRDRTQECANTAFFLR